ncbi:MAG: NUDIX domain-containing protein [Pseudonocardiaceae bacterium]
MHDDIRNYMERLRPAGILYVDVYPYRISPVGDLEFLVLRRRDDVVLAGQWQAVSGKLSAGERIADAFVRQVRMKTGRTPLAVSKLAEVTTFYDEYYDTVMLVPGAAALLGDGDVTLAARLHVAHRWLSRTDACAVLPFPGQHNALAVIEDAVRAGGETPYCQRIADSAYSATRRGNKELRCCWMTCGRRRSERCPQWSVG